MPAASAEDCHTLISPQQHVKQHTGDLHRNRIVRDRHVMGQNHICDTVGKTTAPDSDAYRS